MFDLNEALCQLPEAGGSDLHLKVGSQPLARVDGRLPPIRGGNALTAEDTLAAVGQMLHDPAKLAEFEGEREVDFSYQIDDVARFRVNAFPSAAPSRSSAARSRPSCAPSTTWPCRRSSATWPR